MIANSQKLTKAQEKEFFSIVKEADVMYLVWDELISDGLLQGLNEKLNDIGLYVTDVNILDFDFSEAFISAIEDKQVAQQRLLKAETDKQTAITNAQADAESAKIKAEGEAEANKTLEKSLTENILKNIWIQKWDGKLPMYLTGENSEMMFGILPQAETE